MLPTESGHYWLLTKSSSGRWNLDPEIVSVNMTYSFRRKVVPMVVGSYWRDPLALFTNENSVWSEKLTPPENITKLLPPF